MNDVTHNWFRGFATSAMLVVVLWVVEIANASLGYKLDFFGVYPRHVESLPGILVWPFLHASAEHLILNTTPLFVLGYFVALRGVVVFLQTLLLVTVIGGTGIWLFGRPAFHIGASGLVLGFFGFLIAVVLYERSLAAFGIALFTVIYYGGLIMSIFPAARFISWEAHAFGFCGGLVAARVLAIRPARRRRAP